jgi:chromosomal replication initiator protein
MRPTYALRDSTSARALVQANTISAIKHAVAYFFGMLVEALYYNNTTRAVAVPRQIAMYLAKQMTDASLPEIGRRFSGKHHSTVIHSIAKIEERRRQDAGLDFTISKLTTNILGQVGRPRISSTLN